ncbi:MAG: MFS transporter [Planctomycetaceae bacterium]|nr:MFS transporter [Planctomycetaceae bacterium]
MAALTGSGGRLRETGFIYLFLLLYAFFTTIIGTTLTRLTGEFGLELSQGGVFIALQSIGCFLGIFVSGALIERLGKRVLLPLALTAFGVLVFVVSFSSSLGMYLATLLLAGIAGTMVDVITNASIAQLHVENKGFYMNLLHSCFGIGSFLGPIYAGWILERFGQWRLSYLVLGVASLAAVVVYRLLRTRDDPFPPTSAPVFDRRSTPPAAAPMTPVENRETAGLTASSSSAVPAGTGFRQVLTGRIILCCLVLFLYCGHQAGVNNWLPTFSQTTLGLDPLRSGTVLSAFWLGLIVGRLCCSILTRFVGEKTLIVAGLAVGGGLLLPGFLSGSEFGIYGGAIAAGLFAGATIPMILTLAYTWYPTAQGRISTILFSATTGAAIVVPWFMGVVEGWFGLTAAMTMNACFLIAAAVLAVMLPRGGVIR